MKARPVGVESTTTDLYDQDFFAWTQRSAELLRQGRFAEVDAEHLAEEVEDLGKRDLRELNSRTQVLLMHLLKWKTQPAMRSTSWAGTIRTQRREIASLLRQSPSLRPKLAPEFATNYAETAVDASSDMGISRDQLPRDCRFNLDQTLDREFLPG